MSLSLGLILVFIIAAAVMIKHEMSKKSNLDTKEKLKIFNSRFIASHFPM